MSAIALRLMPLAILLYAGTAWGLTVVFTSIAATGGLGAVVITFWVNLLSVASLVLVNRLRGRRMVWSGPALRFYLFLAVAGSLVPNIAYFAAAAHLPAGVMALVLSMVPILAYPLALMLGRERLRGPRLAGLTLGLAAVGLIVLPGSGAAPQAGAALFVGVALLAPLASAIEALGVENWQATPDPINAMLGASILSGLVALPLALMLRQWVSPLQPWTPAMWAVPAVALISVTAYTGYLALVRIAGAVFSTQVAYVATFTGLLFSMLMLGERYAPQLWLAALLFAVGLALVRPRDIGQSN